MPDYLLDTDHLGILQRPLQLEAAVLKSRLESVGDHNVAVSVVSFQEQTLGWLNYINRARETRKVVFGYAMLQSLIDVYGKLNVVPFDGPAANVFDALQQAKIRVGTMDLRIAAIAISRNLAVVTRNTVHFSKIPGLHCEDWTLA